MAFSPENPRLTKTSRQKIDTEVRQLSNSSLLEDTLLLAKGDCEDGSFTPDGICRYRLLEDELNRRLFRWLNSTDKEAH